MESNITKESLPSIVKNLALYYGCVGTIRYSVKGYSDDRKVTMYVDMRHLTNDNWREFKDDLMTVLLMNEDSNEDVISVNGYYPMGSGKEELNNLISYAYNQELVDDYGLTDLETLYNDTKEQDRQMITRALKHIITNSLKEGDHYED